MFERFEIAVTRAVEDLSTFSGFADSEHRVYTDDARSRLKKISSADLAIFSPPYPNSFDYTDVYNLELWMLGYLRCRRDNRSLRTRTIRSHVQIGWPEARTPRPTPKLKALKNSLEECRKDLWNQHIPEMVMGYFADLENVLVSLSRIVCAGGNVVVAVGDSLYAGVRIDTAGILAEIGERNGYNVEDTCKIRSMRASAQNGSGLDLSETALRLKRQEVAATS